MRIRIVAPSCTLKPEAATAATALAATHFPEARLEIDPRCFDRDGHFAGSDAARLAALREAMADEGVDAVWFARGGYGSNRIAGAALGDLPPAARGKTYLGYSDGGFLLAGLDRAGLDAVHGPMVQDGLRAGGEAAIERALAWLVRRDPRALEGSLARPGRALAFNLTVLTSLMGTALEPDFDGAELLIEDVAEHDYRVDRMMFALVGQPALRPLRRLRMGRFTEVPDNDPPFGRGPAAIVPEWCAAAGIAFGGPADIGHDAANRVVPFRLGAR